MPSTPDGRFEDADYTLPLRFARRHPCLDVRVEVGFVVPLFFRLRNCSQAPNPAGPDDRWFRGAEYVPEEQP